MKLKEIASIMYTTNKNMNPNSKLPNPDDIPNNYSFMEYSHYIANYLILLTHNILFKIGQKLDDYAGLKYDSFKYFNKCITYDVVMPSLNVLFAIRNIMQDNASWFNKLYNAKDNEQRKLFSNYFNKISNVFQHDIFDIVRFVLDCSQLSYEVAKKEQEITGILKAWLHHLKDLRNGRKKISLYHFDSLVDHLLKNQQSETWQIRDKYYTAYKDKVSHLLAGNVNFDIYKMSSDYLDQWRKTLIRKLKELAISALNQTSWQTLFPGYSELVLQSLDQYVSKLEKLDLTIPDKYDYIAEFKTLRDDYKKNIDNAS